MFFVPYPPPTGIAFCMSHFQFLKQRERIWLVQLIFTEYLGQVFQPYCISQVRNRALWCEHSPVGSRTEGGEQIPLERLCVLWVYINNIYYIYGRFSDFWYGFGAGEFITEPNEAHTESAVRAQGIHYFFWFLHMCTAYPMRYRWCHVKSRTHKATPVVFYL